MIVATLWTIAILILTQSREGYIDLALTLLVLTLIVVPPRWRGYIISTLILLAIILGVLVASKRGIVRNWVTGITQSSDPALSLNSIEGRQEVWSRAIYGIRDFPLTGMGMNTFRKVVRVYYPLFDISPELDIGHAHNEFLQAALDLGIPGLIAFIAMYIIGFWMLFRTWHSIRVAIPPALSGQHKETLPMKPSSWLLALNTSPLSDVNLAQIAILGLGGGLLAHMLWGMTDAIALGARPAFLLWIILGLINGLHQQAFRQWRFFDSSESIVGAQNKF
jgi:O-antigen ligase